MAQQNVKTLKEQLVQAQAAEKTFRSKLQESNNSYNDQIEVEKAKTLQSVEKIKRIERDKERLTNQVNQLLQSYKQLEMNIMMY